jgi:tetratricopeptide (TPR) repeat protein
LSIALHLLIAGLIAILLLAGVPVQAQEVTRAQAANLLSSADAQVRRDAASRLGEVGAMSDVPLLLRELRDPDEDARAEAEQAIWLIWGRSGDPEVDALYQKGIGQMTAGALRDGIDTFTQVIERKPDFAEGWNKRATLYFLVGDWRKSLADCDEVMKRNPYHFGALAGYAQIYARLEYYDRSIEYARRALAINPNLDGMRRNIEQLERLIEQRRQQTI